MKLKKQYKIGGHIFKVVLASDHHGYFTDSGYRSGWQNVLVIQRDMASSKQMSVLLHEVTHEICSQCDLRLSESQVGTIAECFHQFLVDNKMLK